MKKLLFILAIALTFAACKTDEPKSFQIKATDMISIKPAAGVAARAPQKVKAAETHLTALEIVKQTTEISTPLFGRSFAREQRDTISATPKLLMWATDVITLDGKLQIESNTGSHGWIEATNVVLVHYDLNTPTVRDTIAYIPNSVLRTAETAISAAYEAKDIEACYNLFNAAYTFTPITGSEWRALKANNQQ